MGCSDCTDGVQLDWEQVWVCCLIVPSAWQCMARATLMRNAGLSESEGIAVDWERSRFPTLVQLFCLYLAPSFWPPGRGGSIGSVHLATPGRDVVCVCGGGGGREVLVAWLFAGWMPCVYVQQCLLYPKVLRSSCLFPKQSSRN
jgi:hypothetical protein